MTDEVLSFLRERFDRLDRRLDGVERRLDGVDGRLQSLERRIAHLMKNTEENAEEGVRLEGEVRRLAARVEALERRHGGLA